MYKKILVPLDGSKQSESALFFASKLARISNAEITLLRVVEYPFEIYSRCDSTAFLIPSQPNETLLAEKDAFYKEAENYLKHIASTVETSVSNISIEIQECPVVESILNTVTRLNIDLIIMSTIGRDHNPWMMGAVANRVLRGAPVPVILIREESLVPLPDPSRHQEALKKEEAWVRASTLSYS